MCGMVFRFHTKCFPKKITMWKLQLDHYACGLFFFCFVYLYFILCIYLYQNKMAQWTILSHIFHGRGGGIRYTLVLLFRCFFCWMGLSVIYFYFLFFCEVLVCLLSYSSQAFVYFIIVSMFKCIFSIPK